MRLRPLSLIAAFVLLLVLAYTAWWVSASWQLRRGIEAWAEQQRALGNTVGYADLTVGGWPLSLDASARDVAVSRPDGASVAMPLLRASAEPWNPLVIHPAFPQGLSLAAPAAGGPSTLKAAGGDGRVTLGLDGQPREVSVNLVKAVLATPAIVGPLPMDSLAGSWVAPDSPPATHQEVALTLSLAATGITLPNPVPQPLPQRVDRLALTAAWKGPLPPDAKADSLRAWSDSGGTVEVPSLRLDWAGIDLRGDATLALDADLQPVAAGRAFLSGTDVLVEALVASGQLKPNQAAAVKAGLGLLTQPQADGRRAVQVPVTLQERKLSVGPVKVLNVPPVAWE